MVLLSCVLLVLNVLVLDGILPLHSLVQQHKREWGNRVREELPDQVFVVQQAVVLEQVDHLERVSNECGPSPSLQQGSLLLSSVAASGPRTCPKAMTKKHCHRSTRVTEKEKVALHWNFASHKLFPEYGKN